MPVEMQFVGAKFRDVKVVRAAHAFEAMHPFRLPEIPAMPAAAAR